MNGYPFQIEKKAYPTDLLSLFTDEKKEGIGYMLHSFWFFIGYWIKTGLDVYLGPFLF